MRTLLIGASGQLGTALEEVFGRSHELLATACHHPQPRDAPLDLRDTAGICTLLDRWRPDLVLLAGAMCQVDRCEEEAELCWNINVAGPRAVAEAARERGARAVFFSTDHVFDGAQASYREGDPVHPLNVYARSKVEAEQLIRDLLPERHLIIRTGWVYGPDRQRRNFILRLIDRVSAGDQVRVPSDQWGSPTCTVDIAEATEHLVRRRETGTFHATGPELIDRVSLARRVCRRFGLNANLVVPQPTSAMGQPAARSLRVLLDCGKLRATGAPAFRDVAAGLDIIATWSAASPLWQHA